MDSSQARDLFLTCDSMFSAVSPLFALIYEKSFYGLTFMPVICKRTVEYVDPKTPYSWEDFSEFEKVVYPILSSYNIYSPTFSLLVYLKNKNSDKILDFDTESCEWLKPNQKQIIMNEHKYWEALSNHHKRQLKV